jgi:hypothetical protein
VAVSVLRARPAGLLVLALVSIAAPGHAEPTPPASADEPPPKLSLPTVADQEAWRRSGFRLTLGLGYGDFVGLQGAPTERMLDFLVRLGLRLDREWSLVGSFQYARLSGPGATGLRFSGTLDPTWHVTSHLSLAVGLGFGRIVSGTSGGPDIAPLGNTLGASYTFPTSNPPLPSCTGTGVAGLARGTWTFVLGPRSATSISVEAFGQWTGCEDDTGQVDRDTGVAIVRRQWWAHTGGTASWEFTWR